MVTDMQDFYIEAGRRIRKSRLLKGYTVEEFAHKVDISLKFVNDIESGRRGFSGKTLYKITEVLEVDSDYILKGRE